MKTKKFSSPLNIGSSILTTLLLSLVLILGCQNSRKEPFKIGIGLANITPPVGYAHYQGVSTGIRDTLYAKALVFRQGDQQGALLICNVIGIPRSLSQHVRQQVAKETGIPFQNISIAATHTHTGPSFNEPLQAYMEHEAAGKLSPEDQKGYIAFLIQGMTEAIAAANKNVQEAVMKSGVGHALSISFNRRYLMTDGRVIMNPGRMNPDVVCPAGPIDPDVHFVLFRSADQADYRASLSVFASHYARGIDEFSADYPSYLEQNLKATFGEQLVSVFGTGTCGNINTIDVSRNTDAPEGTPDSTEWVSIVGKKITDAILEALPDREQRNPDFAVASKVLHLPLQDYTEEELAWAMRGRDDTTQLYPERAWVNNFRRGKILSLSKIRQREAIAPPVSGEPWTLPVEIHVFRLDEQTAIVTLPGEIFVEHGLAIKKHSPFTNTMIIELANASVGYIPTRLAFSQGDYEAINSRLAPGSGEKMVEETIVLLNELKEDAR
jgi:neutral ceramidase